MANIVVAFSQSNEQSVEQIIANVVDYMDDENKENVDIDLLYEDLTYFYSNKINLNQTKKEELDKLQFLSESQKENILSYIYITKGIKSIYELQLINGIDFFTLQMLLPFVEVNNSADNQREKWVLKDIFRRTKHTFFTRTDGTFEHKRGTKEKKYLGLPLYQQFRYNFKASNKIQTGMTAEKDASEQFWGRYNKGFDSYSAYIQLERLWLFDKIILGDFRATFGQGLIMNGSFMTSKSSYVTKVNPSQNGLIRKSSSDEYNFFRGVATTLKFNNFDVSAFYSYRRLDASIDSTTNTFSSIYKTGIFREARDWQKRNSVGMHVVATNLNYRGNIFKIGATFYTSWLSKMMVPEDVPYKAYAFKGNRQTSASFDYRLKLKKFLFFGETALSDRLAFATINGVAVSPVSIVDIVFLHRYYSPKYDVFFAKAFGKSSSVGNENGFYLGAEIMPIRSLKISTYADVFKFPLPTYSASAPTKGFDALLQVDFVPERNINMYIRGKFNSKENNFSDTFFPTYQIEEYSKAAFRYNLNYKFRNWAFRSIVETNFTKSPQKEAQQGFALSQSVVYNTQWHNLSASINYVIFDAEDFNNRFYFYERDIPYSMYIPMLYGKGNRYCLNFEMNIIQQISLYLRFAQTIYADGRKTIGSGLEEIQGNVKSDFKIALKWNFNTYRK